MLPTFLPSSGMVDCSAKVSLGDMDGDVKIPAAIVLDVNVVVPISFKGLGLGSHDMNISLYEVF